MPSADNEKLDSLVTLLTVHHDDAAAVLEETGQRREPQAEMLLQCFQFGITTLRAMQSLLGQGDDLVVCLPTICRPFYELSTRILWATRGEGRWQQLQASLADETRKWAQEAINFPEWAPFAQDSLTRCQKVLERDCGTGVPVRLAPGLEQTLREIEDQDRAQQLHEEQEAGGYQFYYTMIWRRMCGPAHGHLLEITQSPSAHRAVGMMAACCATLACLRALAIASAANQDALRKKNDDLKYLVTDVILGRGLVNLDQFKVTW
jgi:hypothetical protein